jgi:hypothetical protein
MIVRSLRRVLTYHGQARATDGRSSAVASVGYGFVALPSHRSAAAQAHSRL